MKKLIFVVSFFSMKCFAGSVGGTNPPALQDTTFMASVNIGDLPKAYADPQEMRRAFIRLGESGVITTELAVGGETIQVQKLDGSMFDEQVSKEILPSQ